MKYLGFWCVALGFSLFSRSAESATHKYVLNFDNGNRVLYRQDRDLDGLKSGYKVLFQRSTDGPSTELKSGKLLNRLFYSLPSGIEPPHDFITLFSQATEVEQASFTTWFEGDGVRFFVSNNGLISKSCVQSWSKSSAKFFYYGEKSYVAESYETDDEKTGTYISVGEGGRCLKLNSDYTEVDRHDTSSTVDENILRVDGVTGQVNLKSFCPEWVQEAGGEKFTILSCDIRHSSRSGVWVTRVRDSATVQVKDSSLDQANPMSCFSVNDGVLTVVGGRKLDLLKFDAEVRRSKFLGKDTVVLDERNKKVDPQQFFTMFQFKDLVAQAKENPATFPEKSDPQVMVALAESVRARRSSVVLGVPGTGKSSAVRAFARDVSQGLIPGVPRTTQIYEVSMARLESGTQFTGMIAQRVAMMIAAAEATGAIYFIDEIHSTAGVGTSSKKDNDITQNLKQGMETGGLVLIGTDTHDEFHNAFSHDLPFVERFDQIILKAPEGDPLKALIAERMLAEKGVKLSPSLVEEAVSLSSRFDAMSAQPRSAVNLLRKAYAKANPNAELNPTITLDHLRTAAREKYGFDPAQFERKAMLGRLRSLKEGLESELIGNKTAKDEMLALMSRRLTGTGEQSDVSSILLLGPSGVGKTVLATETARLLGYKSTVIEMNKYARSANVQAFRREVYNALNTASFQFFILDEFEKADLTVQADALSMLDTGAFSVQVELGGGKTVTRHLSTKNSVFVLTSNASSERLTLRAEQGNPNTEKQLRALAVSGGISSPIVSRLQRVVEMHAPSRAEFQVALKRYLHHALERESERNELSFVLADEAGFLDYAEKTFLKARTDYRDIRRIVSKIEDLISSTLVEREWEAHSKVELRWTEDLLTVEPAPEYQRYFM